MAMTLRLPAPLEAEAAAYAASLGLPFNNLVAVALREYLDTRPAPKASTPLPVAALPAAPRADAEPGRAGVPRSRARGAEPPALAAPEGSHAKLSPAERLRRNAQAKRAGGAA